MISLRLNRLQLALAFLASALFLAAIAVLLLPAGARPEPALPMPRQGEPIAFEPPLYAVVNDPESPLVELNPFDAARRPPARRRTTASAAEEAAALLQPIPPANFVLLGTVVAGGNLTIAVIRANPLLPGGANYHVGDEVLPGYRVTRITRDGATVVGQGQRFELTIQKPIPGAMF